ncbi:MAG: hypothetical protein AAF717_21280 [Bacteroidota bacterium]
MQDKDTKKESKRVADISIRTLAKPRKLQLERLATDTVVGRFSAGEVEHIFVIDPEVVEPNQKDS